MPTCYWARNSASTQDDQDLIQQTTLRALDDHMPVEQARGHLGMSQIGKSDERTLWLSFRWSLPDQPEPRVRRIFRVGHILENEVVALLKAIPGVELHTQNPSTGGQFNFAFLGGHFAGSMDGCIAGIPEAPKTWHVLEVKTVSSKRFAELQKHGVEKWSSEYYAQMQCYMGASGMERALLIAYNKDNSELYTERVKVDPLFFPAMLAKAERLITNPEPPASSFPKREWFEAKFMSEEAQRVYWGDTLPYPNCRNCRFALASMDSNKALWLCRLKNLALALGQQRVGCSKHNYLPDLMPADLIEKGKTYVTYRTNDGTQFSNASVEPHQASVFSSKELYHISQKGLSAELLTDVVISELRVSLNAEVMGVTV